MIRHRFKEDISGFIKKIKYALRNKNEPMSFLIKEKYNKDPFLILVSCILSLRTKDTVTLPTSLKLFKYASTPEEFLSLSDFQLQQLIYPVGFYRRKALQLKKISLIIKERYGGKVPKTESELLALPGVGIKTANLVLGIAFDIPAICVDIHVHRISNKLGLVVTRTPEQTEKALKLVLPEEYWIEWNKLLVMWGQNTCKRNEPPCLLCELAPVCPKKTSQNKFSQ